MNKLKTFFTSSLPRHLRSTIVAGIFILVPIGITFLILRGAFNFVDGVMQPAVERLVDRDIPGLGLVTLLLVLYLAGLVWTKRIGRRLIRTAQAYLLKLPVVGAVYSPARKLIESFSGDGVSGFKRVVLVEYPKQDTWMIGFLTGITTVEPGTTMGIVYLPTAPTPNSGWVALVPIQQVYDTTLTVKEAMSLVLSGGIAAPMTVKLKPLDMREVGSFLQEGPTSESEVVHTQSGVFEIPFLRKSK